MWTYDASVLNTTTAAGRRNSVRFLVGDTNSSDQQVQDEEIDFALSECGSSIYAGASWVASAIAGLYSRKVNVELDGVLREEYTKLADNYRKLSRDLKQKGSGLGISAGGISVTTIETVRDDTDRPSSAFTMDRFRYPATSVSEEHTEYQEE